METVETIFDAIREGLDLPVLPGWNGGKRQAYAFGFAFAFPDLCSGNWN